MVLRKFVPATIWLVLGYLILYSSDKSEGAVQKFGQILATWVFLIAVLLPIMGACASLAGFSLLAGLDLSNRPRFHIPGTPYR